MNRLAQGMIALLSVVALTACSNTSTESSDEAKGQAKKDDVSAAVTTSAEASGAEEKSAFDTGAYSVKVSQPDEAKMDESLLPYLLAPQLSEYMPLPFEIDPNLAENTGAEAVFEPGDLRYYFLRKQIEMLEENKMWYGFINSGRTHKERKNDPQHDVVIGLFRFEDPESAQKAAAEIYDYDINVGFTFGEEPAASPSTPVSIPGLDTTLVTSEDTDRGLSYSAFTPHEEYLIYTYASAPGSDGNWQSKAVKDVVERQLELLPQYPSVKTKAGYGKTDEWPKKDPHQIIRYVLKTPEGEKDVEIPATYGPRGAAAFFDPPKNVVDTLTSTGSVHNASAESWVFRAADEFGAKGIVNTFTSSSLQHGAEQYEEPQGVPGTTCLKRTHLNGVGFFCNIIVGRYVAQVGEPADNDEKNQQEAKKKVSQKAAAQYLILRKADQNYKDQ